MPVIERPSPRGYFPSRHSPTSEASPRLRQVALDAGGRFRSHSTRPRDSSSTVVGRWPVYSHLVVLAHWASVVPSVCLLCACMLVGCGWDGKSDIEKDRFSLRSAFAMSASLRSAGALVLSVPVQLWSRASMLIQGMSHSARALTVRLSLSVVKA